MWSFGQIILIQLFKKRLEALELFFELLVLIHVQKQKKIKKQHRCAILYNNKLVLIILYGKFDVNSVPKMAENTASKKYEKKERKK